MIWKPNIRRTSLKSVPEILGLKDLYNAPLGWLDEARDKADPYRLTLDLVKKDRRRQVEKTHLEGAVTVLMGGGETVHRLSSTTFKESGA